MLPLFLTMYVLLGLLFIGLAIPLIQRKVKPNPWYGFRVPKTLNNPDVWYPANEYAGWRFLCLGVVTMIVAVVAYFIPNVELHIYAYIVAGTMVLGLIITIVQSFIYLGKLPEEKEGKPSDSGETSTNTNSAA